MTCADPGRARALVSVACFQAMVLADGFVDAPDPDAADVPVVRVGPTADPARVVDEVTAAVGRRKVEEQRGAGDQVYLTELAYDEYLDLVRFRATRRYLLGLMHRHRGSVTEAAHQAGVMRESLHRLLRRHDVEADRFRSDGEP